MNEEFVSLLVDSLKKGFAVAAEQAPALCQEILTYGFMISIFNLTLSLMLLAVVIYIIYKLVRYFNGSDVDDERPIFILIISAIILSFTSFLLGFNICNSASDLIKIKYAPKIYIIDKLRGYE